MLNRSLAIVRFDNPPGTLTFRRVIRNIYQKSMGQYRERLSGRVHVINKGEKMSARIAEKRCYVHHFMPPDLTSPFALQKVSG